MLIKVRAANSKEREEMKRMADIFRGNIVDITDSSYTIALIGTVEKLNAFIAATDRALILETVRSGASGIGRGERILRI
jgi:acetolactate synthase-1/3 small subunit